MKKFVFAIVLLALTASIAHGGYNLKQIMKADLVGVWSTGNSYIWFYEDGGTKRLSPNCSLLGRGTWKFEIGAVKIYAGGKEVIFSQVLKVPTKPKMGDKMVLDTKREWLFLGRDTDQKC